MPRMILDLSNAERIMDECYRILKEHSGAEVDVDYDRGRTRKQGPSPERHKQAEIARDLMRMSELLAAAAGEVSLKYWQFKGYDDPRTAY